MSFSNGQERRHDAELGEQAGEWLLQLESTQSEDGYPDEQARNQAFLEWIGTSPDHLRVFLETVEVHRGLRTIASSHAVKVEALLRQAADVTPLRKELPEELLARAERSAATALANRRPARWLAAAVAATVLLSVGLSAAGYWWFTQQGVYSTRIGEQRSTKLEDGSFIYLNTDSKVEVDFTESARSVRLERGEALFVVERDSSRPFTVTAGDAKVRVIGTQFNVRKHAQSAEVAVIEGVVQLTTTDEQPESPVQKLVAGEEARVSQGRISPRPRQGVVEPLAWRQRRLVFHDASLEDVAAEFNRYNRTRIRVEGAAAREIRLSGIFDADRPQALVLYAAKSSEITVEPEGKDWVIRGR